MRTAFGAAVMLVALAACDSSTAPQPEPVEWNASLSGAEGYDEVEGAAVISAGAASFEAQVEVANLAAGEYEWEVAIGTCEDPGARVGPATAYEQLASDESGDASGTATVTAALQSTTEYHVAVFHMEEEVRVNVACGDLERQ